LTTQVHCSYNVSFRNLLELCRKISQNRRTMIGRGGGLGSDISLGKTKRCKFSPHACELFLNHNHNRKSTNESKEVKKEQVVMEYGNGQGYNGGGRGGFQGGGAGGVRGTCYNCTFSSLQISDHSGSKLIRYRQRTGSSGTSLIGRWDGRDVNDR
jgi:hypothetical protein